MELHKLSLVAQYDDLIRCRSALTVGLETEFVQFVMNQDGCRRHWFERETQVNQLKTSVTELERENVALQTRLKHARSQIDYEIQKRQKVEQERDSVERQICLVRELLNDKGNKTVLNEADREKLAFLSVDLQNSHYETSPKRSLAPIHEASASLLSPSDISFDKTDDFEMSYLRNGKKWKRPAGLDLDETPPDKRSRRTGRKKPRHRRSNSADSPMTILDATDDCHVSKNERHRRHSSPGAKDSPDSAAVTHAHPNTVVTPITDTPAGLKRFGSSSSLTKTHVFASQTCIRSMSCVACGKKLGFGKMYYRCKDCRASSHPDCRELVPLPCIPTVVTPCVSKHGSVTGVIADYAPNDSPMIPALVIHCVREVEQRGLSEVGIYRVSGSDKDVKELKEKFFRGKCPNLARTEDIHVVCGCLKDFLRGLKEPIVTYRLWKKFVAAAEKSDRLDSISAIYQAVGELPQPNRDTMAYVVLHLQRVAESPNCKMPMSNLAKVFGPTIIGYSGPDVEPMQMMAETTKQSQVMERLLSISSDYWMTFLNVEVDVARNCTTTPATPNMSATPRMSEIPHSMLGPVGTASDIETPEKSRWFTPRNGFSKNLTMSTKKTPFFSSPMLK